MLNSEYEEKNISTVINRKIYQKNNFYEKALRQTCKELEIKYRIDITNFPQQTIYFNTNTLYFSTKKDCENFLSLFEYYTKKIYKELKENEEK